MKQLSLEQLTTQTQELSFALTIFAVVIMVKNVFILEIYSSYISKYRNNANQLNLIMFSDWNSRPSCSCCPPTKEKASVEGPPEGKKPWASVGN